MHSKIVQISTDPILKEDYVDSDRYYGDGYEGWFVGEIADYARDMSEEEQDAVLEYWENNPEPGIEIDAMLRRIKIVSKEDYFRKKFEEAKEGAKALLDMSLSDFATHKGSSCIRGIKYCGDDDHDIWVDDVNWDEGSCGGTASLDTLVRDSNDGDWYYIGAIIDYHF